MSKPPEFTARTIQAGLLSWILPGAGHFWLGQRALGWVFFAAVTIPFWTGVVVGGVKYSINARENHWAMTLAELCAGGYTLAGMVWSQAITVGPDTIVQYKGFYPESDVAQIYLVTAGLLNVMVILDAMTRAQTGGLPTFHRELLAAEQVPPEPKP